MSTNEPRALTAALQSPAFVTKGGGSAMHAANRHVERWAPEEGASRIRPLRNLGFVDRLVTPWIESAQRSASLRMFSQVLSSGVGERNATNVSWVFPRPWYQDELDWMAAARQVGSETAMHEASAPSMLTTRGTYVAPVQAQSQIALPAQLHEYVAPSLSLARPDVQVTAETYSPLVPFAAANAAQVMARAVAPMIGGESGAPRMSPGLRAVLSTMLERAARAPGVETQPSRVSMSAPELVTPPAPRPESRLPASGFRSEDAAQVAENYAEQYARVAELQRMARAAAEREMAARVEQARAEQARVAAPQQQPTSSDAQMAEIRAAQQKAIEQRQADIQRRMGDARRQQDALRLHEQSREAAARDARIAAKLQELAASQPAAPTSQPTAVEPRVVEQAAPVRVAEEIAAAVASLPPELASMVTAGISARPDRAVQAIAELGEALRSVELIARNTAAGGTFEPTRGPRLVMPAGLGGLVSTVAHTTGDRADARMPAFAAMPAAMSAAPATAAMTAARAPISPALRMPSLPFISAPRAATMPAPTSALGAATSAMPAALSHVAWSDRWLARFAGANPQSLEVLAAASSPSARMQLLAEMAPHSVYVSPMFEDRSADAQPRGGFDVGFGTGGRGSTDVLPTLRGGPAPSQPVVRFADDAETPDEMLAAIAMSASRARTAAAAPAQPRATLPAVDPDRYVARDTLADLVAHAAPSAPGAGLSAQLASSPFAAALRHVLPLGSAPAFDVRSLFGASLSSTYLAGLLSSTSHEISITSAMPAWASWGDGAAALEPTTRAGLDFSPTYVAPDVERAELGGVDDTREQLAEQAAQLTTLRSALLSWDVETLAAAGAPIETRAMAPSVATASTPLARTMIDSIALPMLGDTAAAYDAFGDATHATTYAAPGMIAERAQAWSVAQERSSSDLAFDFVTPELVLAARVYGLGPAEAAQAARLAVAGPGQLTAMAGAVDRTFVQAMAIEAERRGDRSRVVTAFPVAGDAQAARAADGAPMPATFAPSASTFGVERRAPRGAFLWPAGTTAALGMNAAAPDGEQSMSVAALELLAAQAVAELGTYTALSPDVVRAIGAGDAGTGTAPVASEEAALEAASSMVPTARREKFQALYVALSQSSTGRTWSPAARAARALALAGRGDDTVSARERATVAWDVLPVVYGIDESETVSTGDAAVRAVRRRDELRALDASLGQVFVDGRPGLGNLSARAGEALGSYVTPAAQTSSSSSSSSREVGAVLRAPTAAQELVQTGRPSGRTGGGEVEIPAWFEQAARKMFESQSSSIADGISIAELTLVTAAPAPQVAASSRVAGGSAPVAVAPSAAAGAEKQQIDVEKLANDVYREVLVLMDIARARNGEPYL